MLRLRFTGCHGAGAVTTSEGAAHVPFLNGAGFAVLRYDKRGAGQSGGTYRGLSGANSVTQVDELAGDMAAAVSFLKGQTGIDARRIGVAGVSQAGWIMVAAAKKTPDITFNVAINGSTIPVGPMSSTRIFRLPLRSMQIIRRSPITPAIQVGIRARSWPS